MKNTYEHAIAIFLKRYRGLVAPETYYTDTHEFWNSMYYELVDFYNYINSKDITYTYEDELNYLKVRYLIEKFIHYCEEEPSYIRFFKMTYTYIHIIILVNRQWKKYCK